MNEAFVRTEHVLGGEAMAKLAAARVAIFGLGGVGGYVLEALARSGVGRLDLIDNDRICLSTSTARSSRRATPWAWTRSTPPPRG